MRLLLDTHTLIWFFNGDEKLSDTAKAAILDGDNAKYASIASVWELSIKINLGKLQFAGGAKGFVNLIHRNGFILRGIEAEDIYALEALPLHHRDPFDRILIATALTNNMGVITVDENFPFYGVNCVW
jgi:PIN domain nuclease of toxin-antitoxin system